MIELKKEAARAALSFLKPNQIIGLGAGATIGHLVNFIYKEVSFKDSMSFVTPSLQTAQLLQNCSLACLNYGELSKIDYHFDGCDQVDENLNALKSGAGIHTEEKICATMAQEFIILVDKDKSVPVLNTTFPLCVELLPKALTFVKSKIESLYSAHRVSLSIRMTSETNSPLISVNGNFLLDVYFETMPDLGELNETIKSLPGVIDHSLFYQIASKVIVASPQGIQILKASR